MILWCSIRVEVSNYYSRILQSQFKSSFVFFNLFFLNILLFQKKTFIMFHNWFYIPMFEWWLSELHDFWGIPALSGTSLCWPASERWRINKTSHDYIKGKIQSRHTSMRKYFLWIKINQDNLQDSVVGWYCECKAGARTVGCCAHIATIIWYLRKGKHSQNKPKSNTFSTTVKDAPVVPQTESEL